jgi:hypothetical protein
MRSPDYYREMAEKCRRLARRQGKRRVNSQAHHRYLMQLADRFDSDARDAERAFAGEKPKVSTPS